MQEKLGGVAFRYHGHEITYDENRFVDLTQMWRSVGSPTGRDFRQWKRKEGASFIRDLAKSLNVPQGHVYRTVAGKGGGSWAHWQIALAYAKYLSNDFHRFVNEAFREWAEEQANPDLKVDRAVKAYRRQGRSDGWIQARLQGIATRNSFTDTLLEHGVHREGYALCSDAINDPILGGTSREVKIARNLPAKVSLRDHLDPLELTALRFAEMMAERKIEEGHAHGNGQCCALCGQAGEAVRKAMDVMGLAQSA